MAFSGNFVPLAKSNVEKLDVIVAVAPLVGEVVEVPVPASRAPSKVVVDPVPVAVPVVVDPLERMVAAPAAAKQRIDTPAPTMEPVSLILMFCNPRYLAPSGSYREVNKIFRSSTAHRKAAAFAMSRCQGLFRRLDQWFGLWGRPAADADIGETSGLGIFTTVDVTQVNQTIAAHHGSQTRQVERP